MSYIVTKQCMSITCKCCLTIIVSTNYTSQHPYTPYNVGSTSTPSDTHAHIIPASAFCASFMASYVSYISQDVTVIPDSCEHEDITKQFYKSRHAKCRRGRPTTRSCIPSALSPGSSPISYYLLVCSPNTNFNAVPSIVHITIS